MTDKPTTIETAERAKELNKLIKNDLTRHGMAIVTWGEEDFKPRTELEAELRQFISQLLQSSSLALLREVSEQVNIKFEKATQDFHTEYPPRLTAGGGLVGRVMPQREQKLRLEMAIYGELSDTLETLIKKYERK